jgi:hypothetical protein
MRRFLCPAVSLVLLLVAPGGVLAETFRTVLLPVDGDRNVARFADLLELHLEDNESILLVPRDDLRARLDKTEPFARAKLRSAMASANVDVVVRIGRAAGKKNPPVTVTAYDSEGLDVDRFDVGAVNSPADAKAQAKRAATGLNRFLGTWSAKRAARLVRAEREEAEARRQAEARKASEEASRVARAEKPTPAPKRAVQAEADWDASLIEDEDVPPPPEPDEPPARVSKPAPEPAPRRAERGGGRAVLSPGDDDADDTPPFATETRPRAAPPPREPPPKPRPAARPRVDDDEPLADDELEGDDPPPSPARKPAPRPKPAPKPEPRRPLLGEEGVPTAPGERGMLETFARGLYTLDQPTPYFLVSLGPEVLAWSYALMDRNFQRKTSVCSPDPKRITAFRCMPHGGASLWVEAWPIRYVGVDASVRGAGTVYRAAQDSRGRKLTTPDTVPALLGAGHVAAKARFVLHFGPVPGVSVGGRVRLAYTRAAVAEQKPFVAVPGFHAAQLGVGPEAYLPLLHRHLSFDVRAELTPLVIYQEISGFPPTVMETLLPKTSLNNPGSSSITMGYRVDAGVRGIALFGAFVEWRVYSEGFFAYFSGTGRRTDSQLRRVPDGRVLNGTVGTTIAVGWLFPQGLDLQKEADVKSWLPGGLDQVIMPLINPPKKAGH